MLKIIVLGKIQRSIFLDFVETYGYGCFAWNEDFTLHKVPSYVFQVGHTQVAVDKEMAPDIYVRLEK